jgi:hypothetical protein
MAGAFQQQLNAQEDNLAEGIGQSYGVVGYKGKVWSLRYHGERHTILRPDDGTPSAHLDVIILGQTKNKSKSYYDDWKDGSQERPICSSMDGIVPDSDVVRRQCESCAVCPRNVWKTDPQTGRKGRECTDYKRLAVLILPVQTQKLFGKPLVEPVFLRVPPDSLNSLAVMGETMAQQGFHYSSYIARITFDPQKAHPSMVFRPVQPLSEQEVPVILDLRADPIVGRITGGDLAGLGLQAVSQALSSPGTVATGLAAPATATTQQAAPATPPPQPAAQTNGQTPSSGANVTALNVDTGLVPAGAAQPATNGQTTSATPTAPTPVQTGILSGLTSGGANGASDGPSQPHAASLTVADVGQAEASDDELDARIESMLSANK